MKTFQGTKIIDVYFYIFTKAVSMARENLHKTSNGGGTKRERADRTFGAINAHANKSERKRNRILRSGGFSWDKV